MTTLNERREVLGPVSLDAWFVECKTGFKLHVHLNFEEQKFGSEPESPVRFKLKIQNAQLVLVIPENEPLKCDRSTIYRGLIDGPLRVTEEETTSTQDQQKLKAKASTSGAGAEGSTAHKGGKAQKRKATAKQLHISVGQKIDDHLNNVWLMSADRKRGLVGSPWAAQQSPLLVLTDTRTKKIPTMEPRVRLEIYCAREDLIIEAIELKNDTGKPLWDTADKKQRRRNAAAESYIRSKLMEKELQVLNATEIAEPFTKLKLANVPCIVKAE